MSRIAEELTAAELQSAPLVPPADWRRQLGRSRNAWVGAGILLMLVGVAVLAPWLAPADPFAITGPGLSPPSAAHPFGTDALGRDLFSATLRGARVSLLVAATVAALVLAIGGAVGVIGGYAGGKVDAALTRVTEMFQVLPRFFLTIIVIALFGPGLDRIVLTLGLTSWPTLARVVRGETRALRGLGFLRAAEASGASPVRVLVREIIPNVLPAALVVVGLAVGQVLLLEASLGFLGLGDPEHVSWGSLAGQAQGFLRVAWWLPLFPGLAITAAVLGFNLLADALTEVLAGR
ncbi:MAG: ABC transporter permease [Gemmatimonadales bacterium]